jgi:hypothetical protein
VTPPVTPPRAGNLSWDGRASLLGIQGFGGHGEKLSGGLRGSETALGGRGGYGGALALLVVTPLAFVAFKRWSFHSAERPASGGAAALRCRRDGYRARVAYATRSAGQRR